MIKDPTRAASRREGSLAGLIAALLLLALMGFGFFLAVESASIVNVTSPISAEPNSPTGE